MFNRVILLSVFVFSVLAFEHNINDREKLIKRGNPLKIIEIVKRSLSESFDELSETTTEGTKDVSTVVPTPVSEEVPKEVGMFNEVPKEDTEPKKEETPEAVPTEEKPIVSEEPVDESPQKEDLNIQKSGERIEVEDENEEKPSVPKQPPKEVEEMTPSAHSPSPAPVTPPSTPLPSRPTLPPIKPIVPTLPTVPSSRPVYPPVQPEYPNNIYPNYWESPNWGNWGRFVPSTVPNWAQNFPSFSVAMPSIPTITAVESMPSIPSYSPSNLSPPRFSPFAMNPSSGVPTFSFVVPRNPYPSGGRGYPYPGAQPSVPNYSGFQPSYQPAYQPRYIPPGGPTQGLFPGVGGYYPNIGGNSPAGGYYPGRGQSPRYYPDVPEQPSERQPQPQPQPGADPNQPYGPMGPEMNNPDATMIDPQLMQGNNGPQG